MHTRQSVATVPQDKSIEGFHIVSRNEIQDGVYDPACWNEKTEFPDDLGEVFVSHIPPLESGEIHIGQGTTLRCKSISASRITGGGSLWTEGRITADTIELGGDLHGCSLDVARGTIKGSVALHLGCDVEHDQGSLLIGGDFSSEDGISLAKESELIVEGSILRAGRIAGEGSVLVLGNVTAGDVDLQGHIEARGWMEIERDLRASKTIRAGKHLSVGRRIMAGLADWEMPLFACALILCAEIRRGTVFAGNLVLTQNAASRDGADRWVPDHNVQAHEMVGAVANL